MIPEWTLSKKSLIVAQSLEHGSQEKSESSVY
jgi:hypothetical protein